MVDCSSYKCVLSTVINCIVLCRVQKAEKEEFTGPSPTLESGESLTAQESPPHLELEVTPAPPSPFSSPATPAAITIDYLPDLNPHDDSEGILVVNTMPLDRREMQVKGGRDTSGSTGGGSCSEEAREEDSSSGIIIF